MDSSPNLKKLQTEWRQHKLAYKRDELFCQLVDECSRDPRISPELRSKLNRIDLVAKSESYLHLGSADSLLGLSNLQYTELDYAEQKQIQSLVERKIQNLYEKALQKDQNDDSSLLELHKQLIEQMELYKNNLLKHHAQLQGLLDARVSILPDVSSRLIDQCKLNSKIVEQKLKMLTEKLRIDIFLEIPPKESFEAYKILIDDINKQQEQCNTDIEELDLLLKKYELATCKEYENILATYLKYKKSLNKLKLAFGHS